ncbi:Beta-glucanase, GH16 family [Micrococcales bacterium KH10]|nr:Beta-glucanase, GH16 family [Micrococcales bacterium KH10]
MNSRVIGTVRLRKLLPRRTRRRTKTMATIAFLTLLGTAGLAVTPASAAPGDIIWSDEFEGPAGSAPNGSIWGYDLGAGGWGNNEWQNYTSSRANSQLDGAGNLVITARRESNGQYTSARLSTQGKKTPKFGRVEARIQIPRGQGIWPAFWMLGSNINQVGWPTSGEIDIMENVGYEPHMVHGTVHGPGYSAMNGLTASYTHPQYWSFADTFHTFAVDWKPGYIAWYVDGNKFHEVTPASANGNPWVFDQQFYILLNVAVGGDWPGYPDGGTQFPQQMKVDYVRVYDNGSNGSGGGGSLPTGTSPIKVAGRNLCVDIPWANPANSTQVQIVNCSGNAAQSWTRGGDGSIRALGACLDVRAGGTANGTAVQVYQCNGTGAQKWVYDSGTQALKNPQSGKCLDVPSSQFNDGQKLQIWNCNQTGAQRWTLG